MDYQILKNIDLFSGMSAGDIQTLLSCMSAQTKQYGKNEMILRAGDRAKYIGIVCSGSVQVAREDFLGYRNILAHLTQGDIFGETFSCVGLEHLPVSVFAVTDCTIVLMDYKTSITTCTSACACHNRFIENMLRIMSGKNILLNQKIQILAKRTTREKLIMYLSMQAEETGKQSFDIPFNRQELADYLCVDRSAMSSELGRLRDEGVLAFQRNHFEILQWENKYSG